ncbi:uncharacterized protein LOC130856475 isoform X2 [Hippopotamus amphibius kiboko]|uniref:uncharacterized protein LOC130856475 isoform X2 n=1 Tax=Hippopotamus amphibius kiboko TaxID=575201 RepID=UPI00259505DF|nr:uncharacterized protein LOC130856475 isoform X2 [Hippopotamus amphibius kiboko]
MEQTWPGNITSPGLHFLIAELETGSNCQSPRWSLWVNPRPLAPDLKGCSGRENWEDSLDYKQSAKGGHFSPLSPWPGPTETTGCPSSPQQDPCQRLH